MTRIDFSDDVVVLVGEQENRFVAHKHVLCESSEFFKAACNGEWRESKEKIIRLPENSERAFSIYLHWRYSGYVDLWDGQERPTTYTDKIGITRPDVGPRGARLVACYLLGDMIGDRKFRNALVDSWFALFAETNVVVTAKNVHIIFSKLPVTSKLRQLAVHELAFDFNFEGFEATLPNYSLEVVRAIAAAAVKHSHDPDNAMTPKQRGRCFYHEHEEGEGKCS